MDELERLRLENEQLRARLTAAEQRISGDDVGDRQALDLVLAVVRAASQQTHVSAALNASIREICAHTGWALGEVWVPRDERGEHLVVSHIRSGPELANPALRAFMSASENISIPKGHGLPGRVFVSRQREWLPDIAALPPSQYLRAELAREADLHAALGVPVLAGDEVLAVLAFYLNRPRAEDPRRVELVTAVAAQLGLLLRQQQADAAIARLEEEVMSTPVLQIWEGIALAPVVGSLDLRRMNVLQQTTLAFLEQKRAKVLLLDVTGLAEMDTNVAKALLDLARGARVLGTRAIFTGVRPAMARTLVHLGVPFAEITTAATLADGLRLAIEQAGQGIRR